METLDKAPGQELDNILKLAMRFLHQQHPGLEVSLDLTFVICSPEGALCSIAQIANKLRSMP